MASGSNRAVLSAIAGNFVITVAKAVAFMITGSGALFSEAIHSFADLLNQVLLWIGIKRGSRAADARFQFGYGAERSVWALMSAVGIFFLGCGVTVYHGISSLIDPHPFGDLGWAVGILLFSFVIEFRVLLIAIQETRTQAAGRPFWEFFRTEADPNTAAVLLEDAAACLGVLIALAAILLQKFTGVIYCDAIGSILIGLLLGGVAIFLIVRNHGLLVGSVIPQEAREQIERILKAHPVVLRIVDLRSRVMDSETYRVQAELEFNGEVIAKRLEHELSRAYEEIGDYESFLRFAADYANSVLEELGDCIDRIEEKIQEEVPRAKFLDLEAE